MAAQQRHHFTTNTSNNSIMREKEESQQEEYSTKEAIHDTKGKKTLMADRWNLALLLLLYTLQGIPIGLAGSVPMLLQAKKVGYRNQALFSLVSWPFSIKLLWAPIVDALYSTRFGRRKSWLVPTQYFIGITMILVSYNINSYLGGGDSEGGPPLIIPLTIIFFLLFLCAATQDIAVDGWAITMLSRENVGHASTCNSVGQTAGYFLGYTVFLALDSKDFCNTYLRTVPQETGIVDISHFLFIWGIIFVLVTTMVWFFKKEKKENGSVIKQDIFSAYQQLWAILKLRPVQMYAIFVLTAKVGFAAAENITGLKLIEAGLPREKIALIALPMVPVQILLPLFISRAISGPRPMDLYIKAFPFRLIMTLVFAVIVWWTSVLSPSANGEFSILYYVVLVTAFLLHQVATYSMFVAGMSFHAQVSDPRMGGTYMTLLNTLTNLGSTWAGTSVLWLVDIVSFKDCEGVTDLTLDCDTMQELQACKAAGGHCVTHLDGYYVEIAFCFLLGMVWYLWQRNKIKRLQNTEQSAWVVSQSTDNISATSFH